MIEEINIEFTWENVSDDWKNDSFHINFYIYTDRRTASAKLEKSFGFLTSIFACLTIYNSIRIEMSDLSLKTFNITMNTTFINNTLKM